MPFELYTDKKFSANSKSIITKSNNIIAEYQAQGYTLTLRQLYYQMVSRDYIPNTVQSYNSFSNIIGDARLAGLIDWSAIEDRTRNVKANQHWKKPQDIINDAIKSFQIDKWSSRYQPYRVEVWIEKDALTGVISSTCRRLDIPYFACRGYNSLSEMWSASKRFTKYTRNGQTPIILHLGDHDPSGIDMTRDIVDRLKIFKQENIKVLRLALNARQINEFKPPPNPAKVSDPRAKEYISKYGNSSWELDALSPEVINGLIVNTIEKIVDKEGMTRALIIEKEYIDQLKGIQL